MEKTARAELIAALVTDKFSGFRDGDEAILEAASDARLEEFRTASEGRRTSTTQLVKLEAENRNLSARVKVLDDQMRAAEQGLSEEEFLERAPDRWKQVISEYKAAESAVRTSLVSQLKDLGANTEEELKKMPTEQLKTLATYARIEVPNYSQRGLPVERNAEGKTSYAPPSPYAEGLKALRAKTAH